MFVILLQNLDSNSHLRNAGNGLRWKCCLWCPLCLSWMKFSDFYLLASVSVFGLGVLFTQLLWMFCESRWCVTHQARSVADFSAMELVNISHWFEIIVHSYNQSPVQGMITRSFYVMMEIITVDNPNILAAWCSLLCLSSPLECL